MKKTIVIGLVLLLASCSTAIKQKQTVNYPQSLDKSLWPAYDLMVDFSNADFNTVILPYTKLNTKFKALTDESSACSEEYIQMYLTMRNLNPGSITANTLLIGCEYGTDEEQALYSKSAAETSEVMASLSSGESVDDAIVVNDGLDIEVFLSILGYIIIDLELVENGSQFAYKYHLADEETGEFKYLYFDNFSFLRKIFNGAIKGKIIADEKIFEALFQGLLIKKEPSAVNMMFSLIDKMAEEEDIKNILNKFEVENLPIISLYYLAEYYFNNNKHEEIEPLLDQLITNYELGHVPTAEFLAKLFLSYGDDQEILDEVNAIIDDIDRRTEKGNGSYLLAKYFYQKKNKSKFIYWGNKALEKGFSAPSLKSIISEADIKLYWKPLLKSRLSFDNADSVFDYVSELKKEEKIDKEYIASLLKGLAETGNRDAKYSLAYFYYEYQPYNDSFSRALKWFQEAFADGDSDAANQIGIIYHKGGYGAEKNYTKAYEWYKKGSELKVGTASSNLALLYEKSLGVKFDIQKIEHYYLLATEQGFSKGHVKLGDFYQYNLGEGYYEKAAEQYRLGNSKGCLDCSYELAHLYLNNINDNEQATYWLEQTFQSTYSDGITWLALSFENGAKYLKPDINKTVVYYKKAVELGNGQAMANLGYMYEIGQGVNKDLNKARELYEKSATRNEPQGINNLATFYREGIAGLPLDSEKAISLYQQAAEMNNKYALNNLGKIYFRGKLVEQDYKKALEYFLAAAEHKYTDSYKYLGFLYSTDLVGEANYKLAKKYLLLATEDQSNYDSRLRLAGIYQRGLGGAKNIDEAISLIRTAGKIQNRDLDYYTGQTFNFGGRGIEIDYKLAKQFYSKAENNNVIGAINNLAELYRFGYGVKQDYVKAIDYYKRIIAQGSGIGMYNLAELYRDGHGVSINPKRSFELMQKSANTGFFPAYLELSSFYTKGYGISIDHAKAINWLEAAINEGYSEAYYHLGKKYYDGEGVSVDLNYSLSLMKSAVKEGYEPAQEFINKNLTKDKLECCDL